MNEKQVQMPMSFLMGTFVLFEKILSGEEIYAAEVEPLQKQIEEKIEAMKRREVYTASKISETPEEREAARKKYIKETGIPESYRW